MDLRFGLKIEDINNIIEVLQSDEKIEEAIIFGSRAKGNFKKGSDVDIALKGKLINNDIVSTIGYILNEETIMPYQFDIKNYYSINNNDLIEHIDRVGVVFYKKGDAFCKLIINW